MNPLEVQLRVAGSCPSGESIQAIDQDGSVSCTAEGAGDITGLLAGPGLAGGGGSGDVTLGLATMPNGGFNFSNSSGIVSNHALGTSGTPAASGPGVRLLWYPGKAAFRAGSVRGTQWDDTSIGYHSTAMGLDATASGFGSSALGAGTRASGVYSTAIGFNTTASSDFSSAMGDTSTASGYGSITMGTATMASGINSIAMGSHAVAAGNGSFVYGDRSTILDVTSPAANPNQFLVRAAGGVVFWSSSNTSSGPGVVLFSGTSAWSSLSDANAKENFRDLAGEEVLAKLARMPIREWNFTTQDAAIRHVGPTAQDFHAAFGLGEDPLRISTIDADGIALRAIQALEARTTALREENDGSGRN